VSAVTCGARFVPLTRRGVITGKDAIGPRAEEYVGGRSRRARTGRLSWAGVRAVAEEGKYRINVAFPVAREQNALVFRTRSATIWRRRRRVFAN